MRTSELIGPALDWAVAKCEGVAVELHACNFWADPYNTGRKWQWKPHADWAQGGPLIERDRIDIWWDGDWVAAMCRPGTSSAELDRAEEHGPTPLVAAMRAFVAAYHGDDGTVPDELTK